MNVYINADKSISIEINSEEYKACASYVGLDANTPMSKLNFAELNKLSDYMTKCVLYQKGDDSVAQVAEILEEWEYFDIELHDLNDDRLAVNLRPLTHDAKNSKDIDLPKIPTNHEIVIDEQLLTKDVLKETMATFIHTIKGAATNLNETECFEAFQTTEFYRAYIMQKVFEGVTEQPYINRQKFAYETVDAIKKLFHQIYGESKSTVFYLMPSLSIAMKAVRYVKSGYFIKVKDTYYVISEGNVENLNDFGTEVSSFIFGDDSVLARITSGKLETYKGVK